MKNSWCGSSRAPSKSHWVSITYMGVQARVSTLHTMALCPGLPWCRCCEGEKSCPVLYYWPKSEIYSSCYSYIYHGFALATKTKILHLGLIIHHPYLLSSWKVNSAAALIKALWPPPGIWRRRKHHHTLSVQHVWEKPGLGAVPGALGSTSPAAGEWGRLMAPQVVCPPLPGSMSMIIRQ